MGSEALPMTGQRHYLPPKFDSKTDK